MNQQSIKEKKFGSFFVILQLENHKINRIDQTYKTEIEKKNK